MNSRGGGAVKEKLTLDCVARRTSSTSIRVLPACSLYTVASSSTSAVYPAAAPVPLEPGTAVLLPMYSCSALQCTPPSACGTAHTLHKLQQLDHHSRLVLLHTHGLQNRGNNLRLLGAADETAPTCRVRYERLQSTLSDSIPVFLGACLCRRHGLRFLIHLASNLLRERHGCQWPNKVKRGCDSREKEQCSCL
jgi:hypothetical protein